MTGLISLVAVTSLLVGLVVVLVKKIKPTQN